MSGKFPRTLERIPAVWEELRKISDGGMLEYSRYVAECLYNPSFGYYSDPKALRAGGDGADFFTSQTLPQKVFSELVECAAESMRKLANLPGKLQFAEIGCEPNSGIFPESLKFGYADEIKLDGPLSVVSNELLDARPFSKFVFLDGNWNKIFLKFPGGKIEIDEKYLAPKNVAEVPVPASGEEEKILCERFGENPEEGFKAELSPDAENLFEKICSENWFGILIFADYFRSSAELREFHGGTARSYFRHKEQKSELSRASLADITFSPCSDSLSAIAEKNGLEKVSVLTQEEFFIKYSGEKIREIIESKTGAMDPRRRELAQLLNPSLMGMSFRVLSAVKPKIS